MAKILLIEDSKSIRDAVEAYLQLNDYEVTCFEGCTGVKESIEETRPNLAIVDINLPDGNGLFLARDVLEANGIPFIFLSASIEESSRITGFELGAYDYICKPFSMKELILRVRNILKRLEEPRTTFKNYSTWKLEDNKINLDQNSHRLLVDSKEVKLTSMEWEILLELMKHAGAILSREQIQKAIWHLIDDQNPRTVDSHIKNIRSKLGKIDWIIAVRSFGFSFSGKQVHE